MSRRIGQLFLDRPALTRRATLSNIVNSEDSEQHLLDAVDTGTVDSLTPEIRSPDKYTAENIAPSSSSSSSDTEEEGGQDKDHLQAVRKMEKLKRTLGQNVPPDLVFGTHLALSMYRDPPPPALALSRTSTTTTTTTTTTHITPVNASSTVTTTTTTLSKTAPRPQTPWIAPWEEIDPESYARTHPHANASIDSPTIQNHNSTGRSFWKKAGEAAAAGVVAANGSRRGSEGGFSNNSGSSGGYIGGSGRRTSNDSSSASGTGSSHALSLSVVRIDHPPPSSSSDVALRSAKAPATSRQSPSPSTPGSSTVGLGVVTVAAGKGSMSNLSKIARGAASDANRRGQTAHKNTTPEKTRLNRRRATRMTTIFGMPGPAMDADKDNGDGSEKTLDPRSMAGLAYMLDYERDTLYDLLSRTTDDVDTNSDPEWPYEDETRRTKGKDRSHDDNQQHQGHEHTTRPSARQKQMSSPVLTSTSGSLTHHTTRASSLPPSHPHQSSSSRLRTPSPHPPAFNKSLPLPPPHDPDLHHHHHQPSPSLKRPYPPTTKRNYSHDHDEAYPHDLQPQRQPSPNRSDSQDVTKSRKAPSATDLATLQSLRTARLEKFFHVSYRDLFECMVAFPGVEDVDDTNKDGADKVMDEATLKRILGEKSWERICFDKERERMGMKKGRGREGVVLAQKPSAAAAREGAGAGVSMMAVAEIVAGTRTAAVGAGAGAEAGAGVTTTGLAMPWPRPPRLESMKTKEAAVRRPKTATSPSMSPTTEGHEEESKVSRHRRSASLTLLKPPPGLAMEDSRNSPTTPTHAHANALAFVSTTSTTSTSQTPDSTTSSEFGSLPPSASSIATFATATSSSTSALLKPHPNPLLLAPTHGGYMGRSETPVPPSPPPFAQFRPVASDQEGEAMAPEQLDQKYQHPHHYPYQHQQAYYQTQSQQQRQQTSTSTSTMTTTTAVHVQRKGVIKRVVSVSRAGAAGVRGGGVNNGQDNRNAGEVGGGPKEWRKKGEDMQGVMNRLRELR